MEENTSNNKRILLIAGGVVVTGLLILGMVYKVMPESNEEPITEPSVTSTDEVSIFDVDPIVPEAKVSTEGWKTCRNEKYGYEFQFPAEWHIYGSDSYSNPPEGYKRYIIRESVECNGPAVLVASHDVTLGEGGSSAEPSINIHIRDIRLSEQSMAEGSKAPPTSIHGVDDHYSRKKNRETFLYSINNVHSLFRLYSYPQDQIPNELWYIDVFNEEWRYEIRLRGISDDPTRDIVETILSTFRFLDKENTSTKVEV